MKQIRNWYATFRKADRHHRYSGRFYIVKATSLDKARKFMIDNFGKDWETIYSESEWNDESVPKRLPKARYSELTPQERARDVERDDRIRYKTFREKEAWRHPELHGR